MVLWAVLLLLEDVTLEVILYLAFSVMQGLVPLGVP